jgi:hypothetical protein
MLTKHEDEAMVTWVLNMQKVGLSINIQHLNPSMHCVDNAIMLKLKSISGSFFLSSLPSEPDLNPYLSLLLSGRL